MRKNVILLLVFSFLVMNSVNLSAINLTETMNESEKEMKEENTEDQLLMSGQAEIRMLHIRWFLCMHTMPRRMAGGKRSACWFGGHRQN